MKTTCAECGHDIVINGTQGKCTYCGADLFAVAPTPIPAAPASSPAPSPTTTAPVEPLFPERMKANKVLAGRICPACSQAVELGTEVWNCPKCNGTMHNSCHEQTRRCANPACSASAAPLDLKAPAPSSAEAETGPLVECKFCKEKIQAKARKCRFCGEYQNEADRKRMDKYARAAEEDDSLTTGEMVFGVLCGGIACIVAIIWMIQGKKKGGKLLLISLVSQAVFTLIRLAAQR